MKALTLKEYGNRVLADTTNRARVPLFGGPVWFERLFKHERSLL
jgi:hypothetical protein